MQNPEKQLYDIDLLGRTFRDPDLQNVNFRVLRCLRVESDTKKEVESLRAYMQRVETKTISRWELEDFNKRVELVPEQSSQEYESPSIPTSEQIEQAHEVLDSIPAYSLSKPVQDKSYRGCPHHH